MKGCVLYGRYIFASSKKNEHILQKQARRNDVAAPPVSKADNDAKER